MQLGPHVMHWANRFLSQIKLDGGVMSVKGINSWIAVLAEVRMTNFDDLVIGSLDRLEDELRLTQMQWPPWLLAAACPRPRWR